VRLFRRKLPLDTAMRLMLGATVARDPREALAELAASGSLTPALIDAIAARLPAFEVAVWHQLSVAFVARDLPPEELSRRFMTSLEHALRASIPAAEVEARFAALGNAIVDYLNALGRHTPEEIARDGPFAVLSRRFTELVMQDAGARDDDEGLHAQVHDIAWQSYRAALSAFTALGRNYRIRVT
jgi:hypothetical protein